MPNTRRPSMMSWTASITDDFDALDGAGVNLQHAKASLGHADGGFVEHVLLDDPVADGTVRLLDLGRLDFLGAEDAEHQAAIHDVMDGEYAVVLVGRAAEGLQGRLEGDQRRAILDKGDVVFVTGHVDGLQNNNYCEHLQIGQPQGFFDKILQSGKWGVTFMAAV